MPIDKNQLRHSKDRTDQFSLICFTADTGRYIGQRIIRDENFMPAEFIASPLNFIYGKKVQLLKEDPSSVRIIRYQNICIKYYKYRSLKDMLKVRIKQSKGRKSFQWALIMTDRSIQTPTPLCYLESKKGDSFYLSHFIDDAPNLVIYLRKNSKTNGQNLLISLAHFLNRMLHENIYHLDLKGSNILSINTISKPEFYLIDTDAIAVSRKYSKTLTRKCLLRITRSLADFFTRQDLVVFVEACLCDLPCFSKVDVSDEIVKEALKIKMKK